jgi:hypothetical protein
MKEVLNMPDKSQNGKIHLANWDKSEILYDLYE